MSSGTKTVSSPTRANPPRWVVLGITAVALAAPTSWTVLREPSGVDAAASSRHETLPCMTFPSTSVRFDDSNRRAPLAFDLYRACDGAARRGTVIFLHGGGYWQGSREDARGSSIDLVRDLIRGGFTVVAADYPLSCAGPPKHRERYGISFDSASSRLCGAHLADQVQSVTRLVLFLRARAPSLDIRSDKIALIGVSAGGHIALLAASRIEPPLAGVVNASGATELNAINDQPPHPAPGTRNIRAPLTNALGCDRSSCPSTWKEYDPDNAIGKYASSLELMSIVGARETQVPASSFRRFHRKLTTRRLRNHLLVVPGACHGAGCLRGTAGYASREAVLEFLTAVLAG